MGWLGRFLWGSDRDTAAAERRQRVQTVVAARVRIFRRLTLEQRERLIDLTIRFLADKEFVGRRGLVLTEEMKIIIAAHACVLLLGIPDDRAFRRVAVVAVHPDTFGESAEAIGPDGQSYHIHQPIAGQVSSLGSIEFSWSAVQHSLSSPHDGFNVIYHEFAHALDGADGSMGGMPPLRSWRDEREWAATTKRAFERLRQEAIDGRADVMSAYGATSLTEFFAVATEAFFERPRRLRRWDAELYDLLRRFYGQDTIAYDDGGQAPASL